MHADRGLNALLAPEDAVVGAVPACQRGEERIRDARDHQEERDADGAARQERTPPIDRDRRQREG